MQRVLLGMIAVLCLFFVSGPVAAEIFKYVDEEGKVHFTDAPPVGVDAKPLDIQPNVYEGGNTAKKTMKSTSEASATYKPVAKIQPKLELFVTSWCGYCKKAEAYLRKKGINFTAFDIEKDLRAARRKDSLTSRKGVPFALIGNQKVTGFSELAYERALQNAQ